MEGVIRCKFDNSKKQTQQKPDNFAPSINDVHIPYGIFYVQCWRGKETFQN